jgi:hypothetical protein
VLSTNLDSFNVDDGRKPVICSEFVFKISTEATSVFLANAGSEATGLDHGISCDLPNSLDPEPSFDPIKNEKATLDD